MSIKLIALDLDGTLLTSKKTIDEETLKRLLKVQEMGIHIAITTGRDKGSIDFVSKPLQLEKGNNYVVGVNGQVVYDFYHKEYSVDTLFEAKDAIKVNRVGAKYGFEVITFCGYDKYDFISRRLKFKKKLMSVFLGAPMDYGLKQGHHRFTHIHDSDYVITQDINKFCLIQSAAFFKKHLASIREELSEYDILEVGPTWIEVMPKGVSKGSALIKLGEKIGVSPDEMMAFGDAENDLSMFQSVRYGIAMGNAMDSLKRYAYDVTDTNDQMGIAKALDKYIFKKVK